ncbi:MAG: hypothetical protein GAK43_01383 [Stenotrophomonas maltophilia]|nr:MAG: hypothetical protein GAK43_01383 [Stenotrophomonas maltophilia]
MIHDASSAPATDLVDALFGLRPDTPLHALRHAREKVVSATQGCQQLFFQPAEGERPTLAERYLVAWYASELSQVPEFIEHYRAAALAEGHSAARLTALAAAADAAIGLRERALLSFTRTLILNPAEGGQAALAELQAAGLVTEEIVVLAQLVSYLAYQLRLGAGLRALRAAGEQR